MATFTILLCLFIAACSLAQEPRIKQDEPVHALSDDETVKLIKEELANREAASQIFTSTQTTPEETLPQIKVDTTALSDNSSPSSQLCGEAKSDGTSQDISMELCINLATELVDITLIGPDNVWFGVGFDAIDMNNAYSIVVHDDRLSQVDEFILTQYTPGHPAPFDGAQGIKIIDSTTQNGMKTINLQRTRVSNENGVYSFPSTETTINVIFGKGIGEIYQGPMGGHSAGGVPLQLIHREVINDDGDANGAQEAELGDIPPLTTIQDVIVIDKEEEDEFDLSDIEFSTTTAEKDGFNFNDDEFLSTLMLTSEIGEENDEDVDAIPESWTSFADDIPAILETMDKLKEAKQVLEADYDKNPNYDEYIDGIDNKIEDLLDIYDEIYDDTRELIKMIRRLNVDNDDKRRLQVRDENDRVSDIDDAALIEIKARQMFGGNRFAMMDSMQRLDEAIEKLDEYGGSEEDKIKLKNKMEELMIEYNNAFENTDELIDLIKEFYLMTQDFQ